MYASNSHTYTHLIVALGLVREPTLWGFIISKYPGIHDIGLPTLSDLWRYWIEDTPPPNKGERHLPMNFFRACQSRSTLPVEAAVHGRRHQRQVQARGMRKITVYNNRILIWAIVSFQTRPTIAIEDISPLGFACCRLISKKRKRRLA